MQKYIEVTGKTEDEALTKGLQQLGLDRDDVSVEILERGKTGFLGIGSVPAKVKITYEAPDEPEGKEVKANELIQEEKPAPKEKAVPQPHREVPPEPKEEQPKRESASQPVPTAVVDDDVAAAIVQFQTGLFAHMGVEATPVITREGDTYQVVLEGEDLGALIGRRGETLDAIRRTSMQVMMASHPQCTGCRSFGNCEFQALQQYLSSVNHPGMREFHKETVNLNTNNPLIDRDMVRCIQCGRCVNACPLGLAAKDIVVAFNKGNVELLNQLHADLCMSCGTCSFVCPAKRPLTPSIALAKIMMKNGGKK